MNKILRSSTETWDVRGGIHDATEDALHRVNALKRTGTATMRVVIEPGPYRMVNSADIPVWTITLDIEQVTE
jgi:hypothetical protein